MYFTTFKSCMSVIRIKVNSLYHVTEARKYNHKYKYALRCTIQQILRMKQRINNKTDIASRNTSRDRIVLSVRRKTSCRCECFVVSLYVMCLILTGITFAARIPEFIGMTHQILTSARTVWHSLWRGICTALSLPCLLLTQPII